MFFSGKQNRTPKGTEIICAAYLVTNMLHKKCGPGKPGPQRLQVFAVDDLLFTIITPFDS